MAVGGRREFPPAVATKRAGAIALAGDTLGVADMDWNKPELAAPALRLDRLTQSGPALVQSWPVARIGRVAVSAEGEAWAIQQARIERYQAVEPAQVLRFKVGAVAPAQRVSEAGDASAVSVSPDGKLWVADNGPTQRIRIFDVSEPQPKPAGYFGDEGGVYGGRPGAVAGRKLPPRVVGIGFDAAGKIIVGADGWGWCGTDLRSFTRDGTMNWQWVGLHGVIDMGGFDPGSENDVFSGSEHFTLDWTAPDGAVVEICGLHAGFAAFSRRRAAHQRSLHSRMHARVSRPRQTDHARR